MYTKIHFEIYCELDYMYFSTCITCLSNGRLLVSETGEDEVWDCKKCGATLIGFCLPAQQILKQKQRNLCQSVGCEFAWIAQLSKPFYCTVSLHLGGSFYLHPPIYFHFIVVILFFFCWCYGSPLYLLSRAESKLRMKCNIIIIVQVSVDFLNPYHSTTRATVSAHYEMVQLPTYTD